MAVAIIWAVTVVVVIFDGLLMFAISTEIEVANAFLKVGSGALSP